MSGQPNHGTASHHSPLDSAACCSGSHRICAAGCGNDVGHVCHGFFPPPWIGYFAIEDGRWIGTCAFKGVPKDGRVEIAYYTFPDHENKGVATEMARRLIGIADKEEPDVTVFAYTLPEHNASTTILTKLGFVKLGEVDHPEDGLIWEWELGV